MRKRLRMAILTVLMLLVLPYIWSRLVSPGQRIRVAQNTSFSADSAPHVSPRVVCFNIAHGRGLAKSNWTGESQEVRSRRLEDIATLLKDADADVVVLNEVDFDSTWSHGINQAEYLAGRAGYSYWAEARNLDFRIGWCTWRFGNAVLSRYPIAQAVEIPLPAFRSWEAWLAGKKRGLLCHLQVSDTSTIAVAAVHLSHRSENIRSQSAALLCQLATEIDSPLVVAGDLNSTPPDYPGAVTTDDGDNAMVTLDESGYFQRLPMASPTPAEMTFPADSPARTIDWILIPQTAKFHSYEALPSELSDHRAVVAEIQFAQ